MREKDRGKETNIGKLKERERCIENERVIDIRDRTREINFTGKMSINRHQND